MRGRGAASDPPNRFERLRYEPEPPEAVGPDEERVLPRTEFLRDPARSVISRNQSPDVGFDASLNPYRGCEHGCIYCYARPTHEYLGFSAGLDFETKILVKQDAPERLASELAARSWTPQVLALSGVTDPYQPVERRLRLTRGCLEVLAAFRNPVLVITKNRLVARDADLLADLARHRAAAVFLSVTTLDPDLHRVMEPRTSRPELRLEAITALARAGVPVGVLIGPIIPGLTEHEVPAILARAAQAGAGFARRTLVRLPHAVAPLFVDWLERHFPERKGKVVNRIREMRGGRLNDPRFGHRMHGQGLHAEQIRGLFQLGCRRHGLSSEAVALSTDSFRIPERGPQLPLFA